MHTIMDDALPLSHYQTLGVSKEADKATIERAHRKLLLLCHPDRVSDESEKKQKAEQFQQVQQAYEILSDVDRKLRYDAKLAIERGSSTSSKRYEHRTALSRTGRYEMLDFPQYEKSNSASSSNTTNDSGYATSSSTKR